MTICENSAGAVAICEIAAGMAGLVARYDGTRVMVTDPEAMASLAEQVALLREEAITHWRRVCLRYGDDNRSGKANFEIAALMESSGDLASAMTQYLLTAGRFARDAAAPTAMLRSARIRMTLRDYTGARQALLELLNTYVDVPDAESVYLALGQCSMKAGLLPEATETFTRLYFKEMSLSSRHGGLPGRGPMPLPAGQA